MPWYFMRICIIGCGRHSTELHGPSLQAYSREHSDIQLAACCDRDEFRSVAYQKKFGFSRSYTDMDQMLDEERPEALVLVLPPELTCSIAKRILLRHIPLLMEKPPGLTEAELADLEDSEGEDATPVQVGFNRRFMPLISKAHDLLNRYLPTESVFQINYDMIRFNRLESDFSITAIHAMDAALYLARSPYARARFLYQDLPATEQPVQAMAMEAVCRSGTRVRCNFQPAAGTILERIAIHGFETTITVELPIWESFDTPGTLRIWQKCRLIEEIHGIQEADYKSWGFLAQLDSFLSAVRTHRRPSPNLAEVQQSVILMEAMRERREEVQLIPTASPQQNNPIDQADCAQRI